MVPEGSNHFNSLLEIITMQCQVPVPVNAVHYPDTLGLNPYLYHFQGDRRNSLRKSPRSPASLRPGRLHQVRAASLTPRKAQVQVKPSLHHHQRRGKITSFAYLSWTTISFWRGFLKYLNMRGCKQYSKLTPALVSFIKTIICYHQEVMLQCYLLTSLSSRRKNLSAS